MSLSGVNMLMQLSLLRLALGRSRNSGVGVVLATKSRGPVWPLALRVRCARREAQTLDITVHGGI
jgi:hypothetical protein